MSELLKAYDRSRIPLYIQVASVMRQRVESGQWGPGQQIPTLEELEREFKVARVTVRQAIEILQEEGLLHAQQGRGTFISQRTPDRHWLKLATTWNALIDMVKDNKPRSIKLKERTSPPILQPGDGDLAADYVFLHSVQYRGDEPYSIVNLHLARSVFDRNPNLFMRAPALPLMADLHDVQIWNAHQTLVIGSADPDTANLLRIPIGAPTVECHCVVIDATNRAIYVADIIYRSDCIKLQIDYFARPSGPPPTRRVSAKRAASLISPPRSHPRV